MSDQSFISGYEDTPLTLFCLSAGGFPEQTVYWYWIGVEQTKINNCTTDTKHDHISNTYNVTNTCIIRPAREQNNDTFRCQSSYIDPPFLIEFTEVVLQLICKYKVCC